MTQLLSWKTDYSVNEAELDRHHQKLFSILNTVYENVMNSKEMDCIYPLIDELSECTTSHFTAEEHHMREKEFYGIDAHITKHREFTNTVETLKSRYNGNNLEVAKELIILLGNWLLCHVLTEDKKYSLEFH